jgi:type II secretory pathway component PulJ
MLTPGRRRQLGLSLVELMVGIAVGLFIIGAATLVVTSQLADTRRLLLETQLQQDLRATSDIITRELRRAGSAATTTMAQQGIWHPATGAVVPNNMATISPPDDEEASAEVQFRYERSASQLGPFGFKLEEGIVKSLIGANWQELTDSRVMTVTGFNVTADLPLEFQVPCPRKCPDDTTDCWPTLIVRSFEIAITAASTIDDSVVRTIRSRVRTRNDWLRHNDPGVANRACPA